jgi:pimeloyl-ACP methyl ester carboxylesterase
MPKARLVAFLVMLALTACAGNPTETRTTPPSPGAIFTVNGHELRVWCGGGPGPTVVFEAAVGGDRTLWPIADAIRDIAYACVYDRPGNGDSPPPDKPMTAKGDAADLHQLVATGDIGGPIVIVAHSYGGLIALIEAVEHPDDVAGVVLIDASHPDQWVRWDEILTPEQRQALRDVFKPFLYVDFATSLDQARADFGPFPPIPLTVLSAKHPPEGDACSPGMPCVAMQAIWLELQDEYAALRPDARHVEAATGHYIHEEDPDLVIKEIRSLLTLVENQN